jgi:hypothetical protein
MVLENVKVGFTGKVSDGVSRLGLLAFLGFVHEMGITS